MRSSSAVVLLALALFACGDKDEDGFDGTDPNIVTIDLDEDGSYADEDCDDENPDVYPDADEVCDGVDNDCDGLIDDEDDGVTLTTWFPDNDGDGQGALEDTVEACDAPEGHVNAGGDCDDNDAEVYGSAEEVCDFKDNDCDDEVDEGFTTSWYTDADEDDFGDDATLVESCEQPADTIAVGGDCNDADDAIHPDADEVCDDQVDNDCDGLTDDEDTRTWYEDADEDTYGNADSTLDACAQPDGYVTSSSDCDDTTDLANPGVEEETCDDSLDNDCDGDTDLEDDECQSDTGGGDTAE